jgi:magnesium transporter
MATIAGPEIEQALRDRSFARLRSELDPLVSPELAEVLRGLAPEDQALAFRVLPRDKAADAFEYLPAEDQEGLLKALGTDHVAQILNDMSPDDRTQLLEELPAAATKQLLALLTPDERKQAVQLLGYPEDSIGRLMTPDFITVHARWTVQQALDHIRRNGEDKETLSVINVVDEDGRLIDDLRVRKLLLASPDAQIRDLCDGSFVALKATDDQETAVRVFQEYDRVAFPVTDSRGILLGIVTVDDVLDVAQEEATEDIHKIGGSVALDDPYLQMNLLTVSTIDVFSVRLAQAAALVLFIPMIVSSGGNSGSQAATFVVRAMALGEVTLADWWRVMRREILCGVVLGGLLSVLGASRIVLGHRVFDSYGDQWAALALAVGLSLVCVVLWGVLIGSMLPFALRRLGLDPAASSTPSVATIVDVTGVTIYLALGTAILP